MRNRPNETATDSLRRCVLTGERAQRDALIRLALGPDDSIAPDVRAVAPGRGAWIGVSRDALEEAQAKGQLKGALARAFKTGAISIPDDLAVRIDAALRQALADRLGLESRGGQLITGSDRIEKAARSGKVVLLMHAADARTDGRRKLDQAWRVGNDREASGETGEVLPLDRDALSMALGRDNAVHAALTDTRAAQRILPLLQRLRRFCGQCDADDLADPPADPVSAVGS